MGALAPTTELRPGISVPGTPPTLERPVFATHPVLSCTAAVEAALDEMADVEPMFMRTDDKAAALLELSRLIGRLEELRGRVLVAADDVASRDGARDPAAWLSHHGRLDRGELRRRLRLARACADRSPSVSRALRGGEVGVAQAEAITRALDDLPDHVDAATRHRAEARLLREAARFGPRQLRILGGRVLEVVSPEAAEEHERRLVEREEAHAARTTYLTSRRNGDGTTDLRVRVADAVAHRLPTYLEALTSPRVAGDDRRPYEQRMGSALGAFLECIDPTRLPLHGGDATAILVTVDLEALRSGVGTAAVGDLPISVGGYAGWRAPRASSQPSSGERASWLPWHGSP